ncbi:MAG: formyl transferase [Saprospiraceae bacterium]
MRVVIYTSTNPGCNNELNISKLLRCFPEFEYHFLICESSIKKRRLKELVKEYYVRLRYFNDSRFEFADDLKLIKKRVNDSYVKINYNQYPVYFVEKVNDSESEKRLLELKPDLILQAGAGILTSNIFDIPTLGTINIHHGIAPEIRGIYSTFWCLYYGLYDKIGVTCHFIDKNLDTGIVIDQIKYHYNVGDTFVDIQVALSELGSRTLVNAITKIQKEYQISIKTIDSYYFSNPSSFEYARLKRGGFVSVKDNKHLKSKSLEKREILI